MSCKAIHIISVGKMKNPNCKALVAEYGKRINFTRNVLVTEVNDGEKSKNIEDIQAEEAQRIFAALTEQDIVICLDEKGKCYNSRDFAAFIQKISENANKRPCFILGGAYGLDKAIKEKAKYTLAFGEMTLPHELARVVLYEQLYRAECIMRNSPYHH